MMLTKKPSSEETLERRLEVFRLQMRGLSNVAISRALQVTRNTIIRDSKWLKGNLRELATQADKFDVMGEAMSELEEIKKQALFYASETENPQARNNFLLTSITALEKRVRLMMDAGIIDAAPIGVNLSVEEVRKMSTEELLQKRASMLDHLKKLEVPGGNTN
jgi:hypothetical protein